MTQQEDWGPWIEHDGKGCPVAGQYGRAECADGYEFEKVLGSWVGPSGGIPIDCWDWSCKNLRAFEWDARVIRYRIRKPRGMAILEALLQDLPQDVDA
jgi:hypothetical protein